MKRVQKSLLKTLVMTAAAGTVLFGTVLSVHAEIIGSGNSSYTKTPADSVGFSGPGSTGTLYGPGGVASGEAYINAVSGIEDNSQGSQSAGPKVEELTLFESYFDDFECYCESFNGAAYFYSNVGNNSMTDKSVYVDIPATVEFTMEKDGIPTAYVSNTPLSEYGSYTFRLKTVKDPTQPLSEQIIYSSVFNFRIAKRMKAAESAAAQDNRPSDMPDYSKLPTTPNITQPTMPDFSSGTGNTLENGTILPPEGPEDEDEELNAEETKAAEEEKKEPEVQVLAELTFDMNSGMYTKTFSDGSSVSATVPNGMPVNFAVHTDISEISGSAEDVKVLRNGEEMAYPEDSTFNLPGAYIVRVPFESGSYDYSFSIFSHPVNSPDTLVLPAGTTLDSLKLNGEEADYTTGKNGRINVSLMNEGSYVLDMTDENFQKYETTIVVDRTAPEAEVEQTRSGVQINYSKPTEIDHVEVSIGGGEPQTITGAASEFNEPGSYSVNIYDEAGNCTNLSFRIKQRVNAASIIAVVIIIGLIGGGAAFFWNIRTRSKVK